MVLLLAAAAVLGGVVVVAMGRGGELARFPADSAPLALDQVTPTDLALLQPPRSLWGYDPEVTDQALRLIARAVTERDIEIERLRQQVADLRAAAIPAGPAPASAPAQQPGRDD